MRQEFDMSDKTSQSSEVQGEGDYKSARKFQAEEQAFVKSGRVEQKAREAADALDGPEGPELEAARKASAEGRSVKPSWLRAIPADRPRPAPRSSPRLPHRRSRRSAAGSAAPAPPPVAPGDDRPTA